MGQDIVLIDVEDRGSDKVVKINRKKDVKLLGLLDIQLDVETTINSDNMEIVKESKPWWSILTSDIISGWGDSDKDGIKNIDDKCPETLNGYLVGMDGCHCHDTDYGEDYTIQGGIYLGESFLDPINPGPKIDYLDYCIDEKTLKEYACIEDDKSEITYKCPNICYEGGCKKLVITDLDLKSKSNDNAIITWKTNIPATSKIIYLLDMDDTPKESKGPGGVLEHEVELMGLSTDTTYKFKLESCAIPEYCEYTLFQDLITCGCIVDDICYHKGDKNPGDYCQECDPSISTNSWINCNYNGIMHIYHDGGSETWWKWPTQYLSKGCYDDGFESDTIPLMMDYFIKQNDGEDPTEEGMEGWSVTVICENGKWVPGSQMMTVPELSEMPPLPDL